MDTATQPKKNIIRLVYLYLVSLIGLVIFLIGGVGLVNTGLKALLNVDSQYYMGAPEDMCVSRLQNYTPVTIDGIKASPVAPAAVTPTPVKVDRNSQEFKDCIREEEVRQEKQRKNDQRRDIAEALAMILLGAPVWLYHWKVIQRDHKQIAA